jgi:hypothetical protein
VELPYPEFPQAGLGFILAVDSYRNDLHVLDFTPGLGMFAYLAFDLPADLNRRCRREVYASRHDQLVLRCETKKFARLRFEFWDVTNW